MTVYFDKRRGRWRYDFQLAGQRHNRDCLDQHGSPVTGQRAAEAAERVARQVAAIAPKLPSAGELMLGDVINDLAEGWMSGADWPNKQRYAREILSFMGPSRPMRSIDGAAIQDLITHLSRQPVVIWTGAGRKRTGDAAEDRFWKPHPGGKTRSPATINRYLPVLRAALARAYNTRDPLTRERAIDEIPPVPDLKEPKRKARPAPDAVTLRLQQLLPPHVDEAMRLVLYFGLRRGEAFSLRLHQVDFEQRGIWLNADEVKDDEDAFLPGGAAAMEFLGELVEQAKTRSTSWLITWRRTRKDPAAQAAEPWRPILNPKTAWRTAMDTIEAEFGRRWRFHDLRAAYITQIVMAAGPVAGQRLARHSDFKTTQGYVEVADEALRAAAEFAGPRGSLKLIKGHKS